MWLIYLNLNFNFKLKLSFIEITVQGEKFTQKLPNISQKS